MKPDKGKQRSADSYFEAKEKVKIAYNANFTIRDQQIRSS